MKLFLVTATSAALFCICILNGPTLAAAAPIARAPGTCAVRGEPAEAHRLARFARPGSFSTEADAAEIGTLLDGGIASRYPGETRAALLAVADYSVDRFLKLAARHPELRNLKGEPRHPCAKPAEKAALRKRLLARIEVERLRPPLSPLANAERLAPLARLVTNGDEDDLGELADHVGVDEAKAVEPEWAALVPTSRSQAVIGVTAKERLGLKTAPVFDARVSREGDVLRPVIMGSHPFSGAADSGHGLYVRAEAPIPLAELPLVTDADAHPAAAGRVIDWNAGGEHFRAKFALRRLAADGPLAALASTPDYPALWRGNRLGTLVIVSSNLEEKVIAETTRDYVAYYAGAGFRFVAARIVADTRTLVRERVRGAEQAQFLIKESHADEDEEHILEIAARSRVVRGQRVADGRLEVVEIVSPAEALNPDSAEGRQRIGNAVFGKWMRERERSGGKPLVYLNSSCWSAWGKATGEISEAATPLLVDLPARTMMDTFVNKPGNIMRAIVEGFRANRDYAGMRALMLEDPEYRAGTDNVVLFPDEAAYASITLAAARPATVRTALFRVDSDGREHPYVPKY